MSATGRNLEAREDFDYYPTPWWCIDRLLTNLHVAEIGWRVLEPCAGDGAIVRIFSTLPGLDTLQSIEAWEIQERFEPELISSGASPVHIGDALAIAALYQEAGIRFDIALTNPPFSLAWELLRALWPICDRIVFLLRLSFLASVQRAPWMSTHAPDIYVLPNRPTFRFGRQDNCDYAWFSWDTRIERSRGTVEILDLTPRSERVGESRRK